MCKRVLKRCRINASVPDPRTDSEGRSALTAILEAVELDH